MEFLALPTYIHSIKYSDMWHFFSHNNLLVWEANRSITQDLWWTPSEIHHRHKKYWNESMSSALDNFSFLERYITLIATRNHFINNNFYIIAILKELATFFLLSDILIFITCINIMRTFHLFHQWNSRITILVSLSFFFLSHFLL